MVESDIIKIIKQMVYDTRSTILAFYPRMKFFYSYLENVVSILKDLPLFPLLALCCEGM